MSTVKDVLDRKGPQVSTIDHDATALDAAHLMNKNAIGSLVVIEDEKAIGIITERDILNRVVASERDPANTRVYDVMSTPVACCRLETTLDECRGVMTARRIRHLPVVENDNLCGIITSGDILAQENKEQESTILYLNEYLFATQPPLEQ